MSKLLISYRRADTAAMAGRIRDRLALHFGENQIFMDIDAIPIGVDFRSHVTQAVAKADAVLVLIGADWTGPREDGPPRILEERDPIRLEVEAAFQEKRLIIPVLIDGAKMPAEEALPAAMSGLAYINAAHVDSGRDFNSHMERLIRALESSVGSGKGPAPAAPVSARTAPPVKPGFGGRTSLIAAAALLVIGAVAAAFLLLRNNAPHEAAVPSEIPAATVEAEAGYRDRIKADCIARPTPGLGCVCFADGMAAKLTPNQQLVLLVATQDGSSIETIRKAMADYGVEDPGFPAFLLAAVTEVAQKCMPASGAKESGG
jgi:hypothetical protein